MTLTERRERVLAIDQIPRVTQLGKMIFGGLAHLPQTHERCQVIHLVLAQGPLTWIRRFIQDFPGRFG